MAEATISPMANKIDQIIKEFGQDTTFSSTAMQQFLELKTACDQYEANQRDLLKDQERDKDKIGDLNSKIRTLEAVLGERDHEIAGWMAREHEFKDREDACLKNELAAFYSEKRVEDHQSMVGLIFRNTELRKKSFGEEMHYQPGCIEIKDEYGNIKQYAENAGHVPVPVKKEETSTEE